MKKNSNKEWDIEISSKYNLLAINFQEIWQYRDLLIMFVKRDFVSFYKQTILGPIWYLIQPISTTLMYTFLFGNIAGLSTDGLPKPLFYLSGVIAWSYFADCLTKTSTVFKDNAAIFGKVYFPRLITPLSIIISNLVRFFIQLLLYLIYILFYYFNGIKFNIDYHILLLPFLIILMALQGLGLGLIVSALTTKYRDLAMLLIFSVQLLVYTTTVAYPLSSLHGTTYYIVSHNPITPVIEGFRRATIGEGSFNNSDFIFSIIATLLILFLGLIFYNRVEKNFIDTI